MAQLCTLPAQIGDTRYVYGQRCTWHAPIAMADNSSTRVDTTCTDDEKPTEIVVESPCCPHCGRALLEASSEEHWWLAVQALDRVQPGYEAMLRWSQGRCFPDHDTMQNAFRQAMEGQE